MVISMHNALRGHERTFQYGDDHTYRILMLILKIIRLDTIWSLTGAFGSLADLPTLDRGIDFTKWWFNTNFRMPYGEVTEQIWIEIDAAYRTPNYLGHWWTH